MTTFSISLVYARSATEQDYQEMQVTPAINIYRALQMAGWLDKYPELHQWCEQIITAEQLGLATKPNARKWMVGVYGEKKPLDYSLRANDRIEIYRPLTIDPMNQRKHRAVK